MDITTLENWLWDAACSIRGPLDAPKYKDYILPLLFYKRLSDVYEDELRKLSQAFGNEVMARHLAQEDRALIRFYIPNGHTWPEVRQSPIKRGERLTDAVKAITKENPRLMGVIDIVDFNATAAGQRILDDDTLARLMEILNRQRLGLRDVEPDILGRAYEYLLRKFAEGSGQSAGEFYTPKEVATLMACILDAGEGETVYDPACGSGGLLIKSQLRLREKVAQRLGVDVHDMAPGDLQRPLQLFGQEINHVTYAMAKINAFVHDMDAKIALGDTMKAPGFTTEDGGLRAFDKVTANPMWNQKFGSEVYENDAFNRFTLGTPPSNSGDWGWIQHMLASLKDGGRLAIVIDTSAVSRGSGSRTSNRERDIREQMVEQGLIDAVILLPENLFYNTGAPGVIIVCSKAPRPSKSIRLVNASRLFSKGSPKNYLADEHVETILHAIQSDNDIEGLCRIVDIETIRNLDYDLSPSRHVPVDPDIPAVPLAEALGLARASSNDVAEVEARRTAVYTLMTLDSSHTSNDELLPEGWASEAFEEIILDDFGGDWGAETPEGLVEFVRCQVIRGTDFPDVSRRKLTNVPYRHIALKSFEKRKPQPGDMLVEISGGGKYQNTGRVIYLDKDLLESASLPLLNTNFTRLLRIDRSKVLPKYAFYAWKHLYNLGRTARYEKQPTNIKNFKYRDFLAHEHVVYPLDLNEQARIVEALDALTEEIRLYEHHLLVLESLRHASMTEFLSGRGSYLTEEVERA